MTSLDEVRKRAEIDAETHSYYLTPDQEMLSVLLEGLKTNEERYGYPSCPCRLATGVFELDRDIICPCDYRDPDVLDYGACYCCLYVDAKTFESGDLKTIPERRPMNKQNRAVEKLSETIEKDEGSDSSVGRIDQTRKEEEKTSRSKSSVTDRKFWYCKQCGYVTFRDEPPYICPICRAKREMFAKIEVLIKFQTT